MYARIDFFFKYISIRIFRKFEKYLIALYFAFFTLSECHSNFDPAIFLQFNPKLCDPSQ